MLNSNSSEEAKIEAEKKAEELANSTALVERTQNKLDKLFDSSTPDDEPESAISTPVSNVESAIESTPTNSVVESAESIVSSATESAESAVESEVKSSAEESKTGIPDAYFRAAVHQGWKPKEISEFYKQSPELAKKTFAKLYDDTNKLSREFAAIGRTKQEPPKVEPKKDEQKTKLEFKGVDIDKLRKQYDDDPLVDVVAQIQEQNKLLFEQLQNIPEKSDKEVVDEKALRLQIQEEQLVQKEITSFFKDDTLKSYKEFYGKDWEKLTPDQQSNRWEVVQLADQIIMGAEAQGRKMTVPEALNLAHLSISEPLREQIIRTDIQTKITKRNKSLTLKPNSSKQPTMTKPQNKQDLIAVTEQRLAKVFSKK